MAGDVAKLPTKIAKENSMQIQSTQATQATERRAGAKRSTAARQAGYDARTVQHGLVLQELSNTVCAIEFLMARNVDVAVIRRVLSGKNLRREDRQALAKAKGAAAGSATI
jgi:hypothetical protein